MADTLVFQPSPTAIKVGIYPDHYGSSLEILQGLATRLAAAVPFPHDVTGGPEVEKMGGRRVSGIFTVEMTVQPTSGTVSEAVALLVKNGWHDGLEMVR